jgi:glutathione synthase/RimK-type ligase-like ATP-grasp enzyme
MSICDDKRVTRRIVENCGRAVPGAVDGQTTKKRGRRSSPSMAQVVVKPARGEQGRGVSVGLRTDRGRWRRHVEAAREICLR